MEIIDNLYIGDRSVLSDDDLMPNIDIIISLHGVPCSHEIKRYCFDIADMNLDSDSPYFNSYKKDVISICEQAASIINSALIDDMKVLVHCYSGINRSCLVVSYYMMKYLHHTFDQICSTLDRYRKDYLMNRMFRSILKELEI